MALQIRAGEADVGCTDRERFELELEFLQCLANPQYLNWLAQNRYFEEKSFLNYLTYLQYWKRPEYAKFVIYPHALYFLELLQSPEFRAAIANPAYKEHVHSQQFFYWQHFRGNRVAELRREGPGGGGNGAPAAQRQQAGQPGEGVGQQQPPRQQQGEHGPRGGGPEPGGGT